jgi:glycosyltransferase involved in cell wall biosynthesis
MSQRICFFARVQTPEIVERVEFYAQDIRALRELGYQVQVATRVSQLRAADLYYVWWWTWALAPLAFARLQRRPVIVAGVLDQQYYDRKHPAHRWAIRRVLGGADANFFVSRVELESVTRRFRVNHPRYAPLTVDTADYRPASEPRDAGLVFTVGWTESHNVVRKCFVEVVEAAILVCRQRPDIGFVLAGEHGDYYPRLQARVDEAGMHARIRFPGVLSRADKIANMQRCGVYLQPTRFEGFGMAIAEAMSCGAAVITSPEGEVVHVAGPDALMVDGTRPTEIAAAVLRVLDDPRLREEYGRRARTRMEQRFSYEFRREQIGAVVGEVLARRPRGHHVHHAGAAADANP